MDYIWKKRNMKGNASQICFFRHLALYVGGCVPWGHEVWRLYLSLWEIVDAVMSRRLPLDYVCIVCKKIESVCRAFQTLFPTIAVPCKMHYLVHYPDYIVRYGPLVSIWTMRYEAKHQYFENITKKLGNFKNITSSLPRCHQLLQMFFHVKMLACSWMQLAVNVLRMNICQLMFRTTSPLKTFAERDCLSWKQLLWTILFMQNLASW